VSGGENGVRKNYCRSFRGRPRARSVMSRPRRRAIRVLHGMSPIGTPRVSDWRTPCNASSSIGRLRSASHLRGRSTGQGLSHRVSTDCRLRRTHKLLQRHASARFTSFARRALASTYRHSVRKCPSCCAGKLLNRPLAGRVRVRMPAMGVRHRHPLHPRRQVGAFAGLHNQVPVIGHQAPRQDVRSIWAHQRLTQHALEREVVILFLKQR